MAFDTQADTTTGVHTNGKPPRIDDMDAAVTMSEHSPESLIPRKQIAAIGMPPLPASLEADPEMAAQASNWLNDYVSFSRQWSPRAHDDFHESIGLWLLSTVAARRIKLDFGGEKYTNLYISLASRTSVFAKTTTAKIAQEILKAAGLSFLLAPDEATPQAFVNYLSYRLPDEWDDLGEQEREDELIRLSFAAQKGWFYEEFGQKISGMMKEGGHMADFRGLLRRFDDDEENYKYYTMTRKDIVHYPYLALLGNTTPADLEPYAKKGGPLWRDGFWARFAFLTPPVDSPRRRDRFPRGKRIAPEHLVKPLVQWHRRLGFSTPTITQTETKTGRTKYKLHPTPPVTHDCFMPESVIEMYYEYGDALMDIAAEFPEFDDIAGNYSRLPEKALRITMILASLENDNRIEPRHWARAQQVAETWRRNLHNLYDQVTGNAEESKFEQMEQRIFKLITERGPISKRDAYQYIRGLDSSQANIIIDTMVGAGLLQSIKQGRSERYTLSVDTVDK